MVAGSLQFINKENYYTDDFKKFYKDIEMTQELSQEDLEQWAIWLNDPWSQVHERWIIECNCKNAYTPMNEKTPTFRCIYKVVGMDSITSKIIGYGYTQQEALLDCISHFDYLQREYNTEDKNC